MSKDEQELIIRVNAGDPDFVDIDVTYPKFRRQLERWGFKPIETDPSGGARFRISTRQLKPMSKRKTGTGKPQNAAQKKKAAERMAKAREAKNSD